MEKTNLTYQHEINEINHTFIRGDNFGEEGVVHPAFHNDYLRGVIFGFINDKENKKIKITIEEYKDE